MTILSLTGHIQSLQIDHRPGTRNPLRRFTLSLFTIDLLKIGTQGVNFDLLDVIARNVLGILLQLDTQSV